MQTDMAVLYAVQLRDSLHASVLPYEYNIGSYQKSSLVDCL